MNYYDYGSTSNTVNYSNIQTAAVLLSGGMLIFLGLFTLYCIIVMWKIFTKAGEEGWKSLIPVYNSYILGKIAGKEEWFFLLLFVPIVNIYAIFVIFIGLAHKFGKSTGFGVGCVFLNIIFLSILAFSKNCVYEDGYASSYVSNNDVNYGQGMQTPNGQQFNNVNTMQNAESFNQGVQMQSPVEQPFNSAAPAQNVNPFDQGMQVQPPVEQQFNGVAPAQNMNSFDQGVQVQPPVEQPFNGVAPAQNMNSFGQGMQVQPPVEQPFNGVAPAQNMNSFDQGMQVQSPVEQQFNGATPAQNMNSFGQGIQTGSPSQNAFDNMNNMQDLSSFNQNNNLNQ